MKILFVVPYVPNLIRVRPYNLIRSLADRGHQITLVSPWSEQGEQLGLAEMGQICQQVKSAHLPLTQSLANVALALPSSRPLQSAYCWSPALARQAVGLINSSNGNPPFDAIHIEHLRAAPYGLHLGRYLSASSPSTPSPPLIWDSVDSISFLFRQASSNSKNLINRWIARLELGRTERYESWLLGKFDRVLVTSQADRQFLLSLPHPADQAPSKITVMPNGVDLEYFSGEDVVDREPDTLVISGKMSYHANVSMTLYMVKEIMPLIWAKRPRVKLVVVGKDPPREVLALDDNPSIAVTGTVQDIRPYLRRAAAAVVPITYGAGIQNKVLEAMACGTPVVSTPKAVSAIQAVPGQDVLIGEDPRSFADQVLCLLENPERRAKVGEAGRRFVEQHHHWDVIAKQLENVYLEAGEEKRQKRK